MRMLKLGSVILFFVFVALLATHSLNSINQDIGRHLKTGEIIWQTKHVPRTNLFSFTEPDHPFINHHWLSEVFFYLLNNAAGLKGLIIFKIMVLVAAYALIFFALPPRARGWPFIFAATLSALILIDRTDVRPEIFSYLFLAYFLFAIFRSKYKREHGWLYALPLVQIFWTNMHIYFALGPGLVLFFLIEKLFGKNAGLPAKKLAYVLLATCVATLANPNFIKGALAPLTILQHYGYSIVENQSISFLTDYGIMLPVIKIFELSILALIVSFIIGFIHSRGRIFELLTAAVFTVLAIKMIRNFGPYAFVFTAVVAANLGEIQIDLDTKAKKIGRAIFYSLLILAMILLTRVVINNRLYARLDPPERFGLTIPAGSEGGIKFIRQNGIHGPLFNNFDVGSFLIWKLYPAERVFVDGRPEAYSVDFFERVYKPMQTDPALWRKYSEQYGINYIFFAHTDITPWAQVFLQHITADPNWPLVYLDQTTAIFLKRAPANDPVVKRFEIKIHK